MPQLPSGRHVALDPTPLNKLIDDILHEKTIANWPLLAIESANDCLQHIEIIYLEPNAEGDTPRPAKSSAPMDASLRKIETGLRVSDVLSEISDWSKADKDFFCEFLESDRVKTFLDNYFEQVVKVQSALNENGNFLQKWESNAWKAGCHPLQKDDQDE